MIYYPNKSSPQVCSYVLFPESSVSEDFFLELLDNANRTALDCASAAHAPHCVKLLIQHSATVLERHGHIYGRPRPETDPPVRRGGGHAKKKTTISRKAWQREKTMKMLPRIHYRLMAASYSIGGQDWERLYNFYDKDGSGQVGLEPVLP